MRTHSCAVPRSSGNVFGIGPTEVSVIQGINWVARWFIRRTELPGMNPGATILSFPRIGREAGGEGRYPGLPLSFKDSAGMIISHITRDNANIPARNDPVASARKPTSVGPVNPPISPIEK
jgi:hypothetical protein